MTQLLCLSSGAGRSQWQEMEHDATVSPGPVSSEVEYQTEDEKGCKQVQNWKKIS